MKTVIIVQARMTSTRLPGKVLMSVLGRPLLECLIERLRRVRLADDIVLATTVNSADQPIVELGRRLGVHVYRGAEHDVLSRYFETARTYNADTVVRITADCPLLDPLEVDKVIGFYQKHRGEFDYVTNGLEEPYPHGMDCEVFSFNALQKAFDSATSPFEREHVTVYLYQKRDIFSVANVPFNHFPLTMRLTVDTLEDFLLVSKIYEYLYPVNKEFTLQDIIDTLLAHPDLGRINAHIKQNGIL